MEENHSPTSITMAPTSRAASRAPTEQLLYYYYDLIDISWLQLSLSQGSNSNYNYIMAPTDNCSYSCHAGYSLHLQLVASIIATAITIMATLIIAKALMASLVQLLTTTAISLSWLVLHLQLSRLILLQPTAIMRTTAITIMTSHNDMYL
jgi:hypothetical protein